MGFQRQFSHTRFKSDRTSIEARYLANRVVMSDDNPGAILDGLAKRLSDNEVVSVTVRGDSNRPVEAGF